MREIVTGRLFALGGEVPADGRVSWLPDAAGAAQPVSCYLLPGAESLLVDTGLAIHEKAVLEPLGELLPSGGRLTVFLTRSESDCIGNLEAIARDLPLEAVYSGGRSNPFDSFDYVREVVLAARPEAVLGRVPPGQELQVGEHRLQVIAAPLRVLTTFWAYEPGTRTLFTSDAFGFEPGLGRESLLAKFDWLPGSRALGRLGGEVAALLESWPMARLAPGHGPVIEGEGVGRALAELCEALASIP